MISYEIIKVEPQQLKLQVKYTKENCPDYWINFVVRDFSEENVHQVASDGASTAQNFYDNISALPDEVTLSSTTGTVKDRVFVECPEYDNMYQDANFTWVESDDALTQTWTITEKSDEEKADKIRHERTNRLRKTDHHAMSDQTLTSEMTAYRQALRDVPQQSGFPSSVDWPTEP